MKQAAAAQKQIKSGPLSPHNLDLIHAINQRDVQLYYYILQLHRSKVRLCLRTNGTNTGPVHAASDHPAWSNKDVGSLLSFK